MSDADRAEAARLAYEMSSTLRDLNAMGTPATRVCSANRTSE